MVLRVTLKKLLGRTAPPEGVILKQLLPQFLPDNLSVIDAGAHIGRDTLEMSRLWKDGRIYAFEPVPALFAKLQANTRKCKNVHCFNLALSDKTGEQPMFISSGASDGSSSLLQPTGHLIDHPDTFFRETIMVRTMTIDDGAREQAVSAIDLLWLDMQGLELAVLKAAPRILKTVYVIHTEVSVREQYAKAPLYPEVRSWLEEQGFQVEVEAIPPSWDGGNVLFVRR